MEYSIILYSFIHVIVWFQTTEFKIQLFIYNVVGF